MAEESAAATPLFWARGQYKTKILLEHQLYGVNKLEGVGVNAMACLYPVGHASSNYEEINNITGFLESVLCTQTQTEKVPKSVNIEQEVAGNTMEEDNINVLLYYLCALGIDKATLIDGFLPSAATVL